MDCTLNIPKHLHRNRRVEEQDFSSDNLLFCRIPPEYYDTNKKLNWKRVIRSQDQSVNRDFLWLIKEGKAEDVLFSIDPSVNDYTDNGILKINLRKVMNKKRELDAERTFCISIVHKPENCMFPHCEIKILENGKYSPTISPNSIKTWFRELVADNSTLIKEPSC